MRYNLHYLKLEKECIRAEREEVLQVVNSYRLDNETAKLRQNLTNHLEALEVAIAEQIAEIESKIESIPDADTREMARLYYGN